MRQNYHEYRSQSNYLSTDPDDAGVCVRVSGNLLLVYNTARGNPDIDHSSRKQRTAIKEFSLGTGVRMARYLRESTSDYRYMHTLTYPSEYETDGRIVKQHLRRYCQELSREAKRRGDTKHSTFWFLEFQNRGAPHFHLFTTTFFSYKRCAIIWYSIVNSGDENHLKAGVRVESLKKGKKGMISYARKYARKQEQKKVPENYSNVGRFWGVHGVKIRVAAGTTFYNDSCRKAHILEQKQHVFNEISRFIAIGGIRTVKNSFGFRMFHVEPSCLEEIMVLVRRAQFFVQEDDDLFADAELTKDGDIGELPLFGYELRLAKKAYLKVKFGEINFEDMYRG